VVAEEVEVKVKTELEVKVKVKMEVKVSEDSYQITYFDNIWVSKLL